MEASEAAAREAIRDTIARYAHGADTGHFDEVAGCFTEGGVLEIEGGGRLEGRSAIRDYLGGVGHDRAAAPTDSYIRHHVSSTWITVTSPTEATARSYFFVVTEHGTDHWGRYRDTLVPADDRWLFAYRLARTDGATPGGWAASRLK